MGGQRQREYPPEVRLHLNAMINSFVREGRRESKLLRHREFLDDLNHALPAWLVAGRYIEVSKQLKSAGVIAVFVQRLTKEAEAIFLGAISGFEQGRMPIEQAIEQLHAYGGAAVSIEPGELVVYQEESPGRLFLLIADPARMKLAQRLLQSI